MYLFSFPFVETFVLGTQKNYLIDTVLLSTQNICFGKELLIRQIVSVTHSYLKAWTEEAMLDKCP